MKSIMASRQWFTILMLAFFLVSCSRLPIIKPADPATIKNTIQRCHLPFHSTPYRFIHAIEVELSGRGAGTVVGVTVFDPTTENIHSVIMTIEGFVLFDAQYEKEIHVNRAVPPFDKEQFAGRMMEDVKLIFLAPHGKLSDAGMREDGSTVCRYSGNTGIIEDVIIRTDDSWEIGTYSDSHELIRQVKAYSVRDRIPDRIELNSFGFREYSLRMKLISAEAVTPEEIRASPRETQEEDE
ncbi:MAG: hypothetical protein ABFD82_06775 [Syntrophaceae bacterium]